MSYAIGSLFSGYGGLELGVGEVLGAGVAWHAEIDPGASAILAHRFPGVPNLGDITAVDWSAVEPVDVLTGGFPCQDVSSAGLRKGLRPDTRSGLWTQMAYAIDQLRPGLVVIENVRGLLSAEAHSDLEPCPWCVGDGGGIPLRALGAVLGDLADIGYDASWHGLRAADVGAPHGRFRVFVTAWPADPDSPDRPGRLIEPGPETAGGRMRPGSAVDRRDPAAHPQGHGRHEGRAEPARLVGGSDAAFGGVPAADPDGTGLERRVEHARPAAQGRRTDPRAGGRPATGHAAQAAAHPDGHGSQGLRRLDTGQRDPDRCSGADVVWGDFEPAIRRWERLTRPAPAPTEPNSRGQQRLSPAFVEWMMGLPAGWVTDVPGLGRNAQLKALGNGVVPQQAAAALRTLLDDYDTMTEETAA